MKITFEELGRLSGFYDEDVVVEECMGDAVDIAVSSDVVIEGSLAIKAMTGARSVSFSGCNLLVRGDLVIDCCCVEIVNLGNVTVCHDIEIKSCDALSEVTGDITVGGCMYILSCGALHLLDGKIRVGMTMEVSKCDKLVSLPDWMIIGNNFEFVHSNVRRIPPMMVGNRIMMYGARELEEISPDVDCVDLQVTESVRLKRLTRLPRVRTDIKVIDCRELTEVEDGMACKGHLSLYGCTSLKSIPSDVRADGITAPYHDMVSKDMLVKSHTPQAKMCTKYGMWSFFSDDIVMFEDGEGNKYTVIQGTLKYVTGFDDDGKVAMLKNLADDGVEFVVMEHTTFPVSGSEHEGCFVYACSDTLPKAYATLRHYARKPDLFKYVSLDIDAPMSVVRAAVCYCEVAGISYNEALKALSDAEPRSYTIREVIRLTSERNSVGCDKFKAFFVNDGN